MSTDENFGLQFAAIVASTLVGLSNDVQIGLQAVTLRDHASADGVIHDDYWRGLSDGINLFAEALKAGATGGLDEARKQADS